MTWSIVHSIPVTSAADNHTAMTYLFDTYLDSKTAWTVEAHPSALAYRRKAKCTLNNKFGGTYIMYYWVSWSNTSPSNWTWYEDATYTTVPGDLCTDTTNSIVNSTSFSSASTTWYFCQSSENTQSMLVLQGTRPYFYWPGITEGLFFDDTTWNGSSDSLRTCIVPYVGFTYGSLSNLNAPVNTGTSTTEQYMIPSVGYTNSGTANVIPGNIGNWIGTNFSWLYSTNTTSATPDSASQIAFTNGGHTDTGIWMPGSGWSSNSDARRPFPSGAGTTLLVGSNYWWCASTDLGRQPILFDFGTSDPGIV